MLKYIYIFNIKYQAIKKVLGCFGLLIACSVSFVHDIP